MGVIIRNNLSGIASQCHLSSIGEALAFRKALSLRQRLPSVGELSSECETERLPLAFPLPSERKYTMLIIHLILK